MKPSEKKKAGADKRIEELDKNLKPKEVAEPAGLAWASAADPKFTVQGLAWFKENGGIFSRLPLRAKDRVREPVWQLGQCPAGGRVAFRSDTADLAVRVTNVSAGHMMHMASSGSNGLALYCGEPYRMKAWGSAIPDAAAAVFERELFKGLPKKMREFRLYLPLYHAMEKLEIGLSSGASVLAPTPPAIEQPVVFYGTSITQGGCSSTAGDDFVSRVGRVLNLDVVNLGFSGNGRGEPEMAELVSEIDASLYVLDYAGNVGPEEMQKTLPVFFRILRDRRPVTPVLLLTHLCYAGYDNNQGTRVRLETTRDIVMDFYVSQRKSGEQNIHFADGFSLIHFGADGAYVDGGHPTSHGFALMAERLAPVVERILMRDN